MAETFIREEAVAIAKDFANYIRAELDEAAQVCLFGSTVRNEAHSGSDIDIAVISKAFSDENIAGNYGIIGVLASNVHWDIEAHPITIEHWKNASPFINEIKEKGIFV